MAEADYSDASFYIPLFSFMRLVEARLDEEAGISTLGFRILNVLGSGGDPLPLSSLARALDVPRSAVSMSVSKMRASDLVKCRYSESGSRTASVDLSWRGRQLYARARRAVDEAVSDAMGALGPGDRETTAHYLIMMADQTGSIKMSDGRFDSTSAFLEVCSRIKQLFTRNARKFGLSPDEYLILSDLFDFDCGMRPVDLSRALLIKRSDVSTKCKMLERKGLISRVPDPGDKRGVIVSATAEGRVLMSRARASYKRAFLTQVRDMNMAEQTYFLALSGKLRSEQGRTFRG